MLKGKLERVNHYKSLKPTLRQEAAQIATKNYIRAQMQVSEVSDSYNQQEEEGFSYGLLVNETRKENPFDVLLSKIEKS